MKKSWVEKSHDHRIGGFNYLILERKSLRGSYTNKNAIIPPQRIKEEQLRIEMQEKGYLRFSNKNPEETIVNELHALQTTMNNHLKNTRMKG